MMQGRLTPLISICIILLLKDTRAPPFLAVDGFLKKSTIVSMRSANEDILLLVLGEETQTIDFVNFLSAKMTGLGL
jgi:hypothetical protein